MNIVKLAYKQHKLIKNIEKALGFKLYPWQIEYIFTGSMDSRPIGRQTGMTTAYIIRMLLDKATPLYIPGACGSGEFNFVTDRPDDRMYTRWMANETLRIFGKLIDAGVGVRHTVAWPDVFIDECKLERKYYEQETDYEP